MTAHDPNMSRAGGGLLRWFGLGSDDSRPDQSTSQSSGETPAAPANEDRQERRRRQLLDDIMRFLLTHRLQVSMETLAIAYNVMSGGNPRLARLIEERVQAREPITTAWIEDIARSNTPDDGAQAIEALVAKLETSIEAFGQTTREAQSATSAYNSALEVHVGEIERVGDAGAVITELANIAKVMLERTREIERKISVSEKETRALQQNLEDARREAELDHLTGLPNRRSFEAVLDSEYEKAIINQEPICVAFCDLDHFKKINDTHGHDAGDRVLRSAAMALGKISNERCHVARHGGEEFVVLFRGKTLDEAFAELDATREEMAERRMVNRKTDMPFGKITFSAGIADVMCFDSPRDALRAADEALYAAKNNGRNQVMRAEADAARKTA